MIVASSLALLSLILPPASILSSAAVALVTLRLGAFEGLSVLVCSSLAAALLGLIIFGNYQFALVYAGIMWLPVWLISIILREGRHLSLAVEIAVLLGILGIIGFYLYNPDPVAVWKAMLMQMVPADAPVEIVQQKVDTLSHYMTGIIAAGSVFSLLFGLFLGRWWQANLYNPGGFRIEFLSLTAHLGLSIGSVIVIALAMLSSGTLSELSWNASILLFVLYIIIGTAVLHTLFADMKMARYIVPMFYVTLFVIPHVLLPVAFVGFTDTWLNLRKNKST